MQRFPFQISKLPGLAECRVVGRWVKRHGLRARGQKVANWSDLTDEDFVLMHVCRYVHISTPFRSKSWMTSAFDSMGHYWNHRHDFNPLEFTDHTTPLRTPNGTHPVIAAPINPRFALNFWTFAAALNGDDLGMKGNFLIAPDNFHYIFGQEVWELFGPCTWGFAHPFPPKNYKIVTPGGATKDTRPWVSYARMRAKIERLGVLTLDLTGSSAESHWPGAPPKKI